MAKGKDEATGSRSDPETRKTSLLLSGLVLTPDGGLAQFRDRRLPDGSLDLEHLRRARDILDAVGAAITTGEPALWAQVERAWQALQAGQGAAERAATAPAAPLAGAGIDVEALNRVKLDADEAKTLPVDHLRVTDGALPFTGGPAEPPPPATQHDPDDDPLRATMGLDGPPAGGEAALPFRPEPDPGQPGGAAGAGGDDELLSMTDEVPTGRRVPDEEVTKAIEVPIATAHEAGADLPPPLAAMTVEHYAALCAETAAHPGWVEDIHRRYQVADSRQRAALDQAWKERMAADAELERTWRWHLDRYQEWAKKP